MLIGTYFENLWILDATMISKILDSANAMARCIGKRDKRSRNRTAGVLEIEMLTVQKIVYIDGWVGHFEQVPRGYDTWSGIDQGTIHIEETM